MGIAFKEVQKKNFSMFSASNTQVKGISFRGQIPLTGGNHLNFLSQTIYAASYPRHSALACIIGKQ